MSFSARMAASSLRRPLAGLVRIWNVRNGSEFGVIRGHTGPVEHVAFSPDGARLLTASHDGTARLWEINGVSTTALRHGGPPTFARFSPDGTRVITVSTRARTTHLWDVASGREIFSVRRHIARNAAVGPNGRRIATASTDRTVRLWDAESGVEIARMKGHDNRVAFVNFSADGKLVASASIDGTARIWDASDGKELAVLKANGAPLSQAVFSPDDRLVLTALNDNTARLWKTDGTEFQVLAGHENTVTAAAFSPDGQLVATASLDETARIWNVEDGRGCRCSGGPHRAPHWRLVQPGRSLNRGHLARSNGPCLGRQDRCRARGPQGP